MTYTNRGENDMGIQKVDPAKPPREKTLLGGVPAKWGNGAPRVNVQDTWRKYGWDPTVYPEGRIGVLSNGTKV